jgi:hypothetical protein
MHGASPNSVIDLYSLPPAYNRSSPPLFPSYNHHQNGPNGGNGMNHQQPQHPTPFPAHHDFPPHAHGNNMKVKPPLHPIHANNSYPHHGNGNNGGNNGNWNHRSSSPVYPHYSANNGSVYGEDMYNNVYPNNTNSTRYMPSLSHRHPLGITVNTNSANRVWSDNVSNGSNCRDWEREREDPRDALAPLFAGLFGGNNNNSVNNSNNMNGGSNGSSLGSSISSQSSLFDEEFSSHLLGPMYSSNVNNHGYNGSHSAWEHLGLY